MIERNRAVVSLMWYDVLILGLLVFFAIRGAVKGVVFQLASIAGIVLCFVFAGGISHTLGPYVHLDPPMNHWVVFGTAYLAFTFGCYLIARVLNDWLEKNKLKDFDRHLGAILGFVKGVALSLVLTFFVVTMSQSARAALKNSYSGRYAAILMDRLHPILPEKLHDAVAEYIHLLDSPDLDLKYSHEDEHNHQNVDSILGSPTSFPASTIPGDSSSGPAPAQSLWTQLQSFLNPDSQRVISDALQSADPQSRSQIEQNLHTLLNSSSAPDRATLQQQIVQVGAGQLQQFLDWRLKSLMGPVNSNSSETTPANSGATNNLVQQRDLLTRQIAELYSAIPNIQQSIEVDIAQRIAGVPDMVSVAVLQDWKADLTRTQPDPDPQTVSNSLIEERILRQLQFAGIRVEQLSPQLQQRLRALQAQRSSANNPL
jgi:membrane protein required for colicin V production